MSAFWRCTITYLNVRTQLRSQNVVWMEDPSGNASAIVLGAALDMYWWGNQSPSGLRQMSSFNVKNEGYQLQRVSPAPPMGSVPVVGSNMTGSIGGTIAYPTVGLLFTLYDGGSGRKHRGRVYHSATAATDLTDSVPAGSVLTRFPILRDAWLNAFGPLPTSGFYWNIYHRKESGDARWTRVKDIAMQPYAKCQRRRNFGYGQ